MAIENAKLVNLQDAKVLYDDLRGRVEGLIDDTSTSQSKVWSASKTSEETSALKSAKAPIITESISTPADVQTFSDGADNLPVKTLTVGIEPVQDLHGQENPYPAGGGTNKFNEDTELGGIGSNGVPYSTNDSIRSKTFSSCKGSTGYYVLGTIAVYFYDSSENFIEVQYANNNIKTSPANAAYFKLGYYGTYGTTYKYDTAVNDPSSVTTYAPYSNICPISGHTGANVYRTGVNIWDEQWEKVGSHIETANYINVLPSTEYYWCAPYMPGNGFIFYDADKNVISTVYTFSSTSNVITTPANCYYVKFKMGNNYGDAYNGDIAINYPKTDTTYHAGHVATYSITFPTPPGTVYGGTLTIHQDGSGELVVDRANVDLGTLDWASLLENANWKCFTSTISTKAKGLDNLLCSQYPYGIIYMTETDCIISGNGSNTSVYVRDNRYTDAATFKTAMSGVQLVYELATPVTYQLTNQQVIETLKGVNNVWADTGKINAVDYPADTKLYIDKKLTELQALVLEN